MNLLQDANPHDNPTLKELLNEIQLKEAECFERVYKRFCWLNGVRFDLAKIEPQTFDLKPNKIDYYYMGPVPKAKGIKHFLMSRDLIMVKGQELPTLEIKWNMNLIDETKEN